MPKTISLAAALFLTLAGASADFRANAEELPPKLKVIPACSAITTAAATNHIPIFGLDRSLTNNLVHAGDSVTLLGTMCLKKNQAQWLLYVEAEPPGTNAPNRPPMVVNMFNRKMSFESRPVPARLRMLGPFAVSGTSEFKPHEQNAQFTLNESFLGIGLDRAASVIWHHHQLTNSTSSKIPDAKNQKLDTKMTPDEEQAFAGAVPALMSYFEIVQHTEGLEDLLSKLVKLPSVWSIVRHLGVNAGIYFGDEAFPANPADWDLPPQTRVYYLPCMLKINDQPSVKSPLWSLPRIHLASSAEAWWGCLLKRLAMMIRT